MNRMLLRAGLLLGTILASIALIAPTLSAASAALPADDPLRIGLVRYHSGVKQVSVSVSCSFTVLGASGGELFSGESGTALALSATSSAIALKSGAAEPRDLGASITVMPRDPAGSLTVTSAGRPTKQYRGALELRLKSSALQLVNIVRLEDYLLGVVPAEMPDLYPIEALKAQAVAARTYALRNRQKRSSSGYNLSDDSDCQVYDGVTREKPNATRAVLDTAGIILTYRGLPADAMYSTDCGGATQDYAANHPGRDFPYLCAVREPCEIPHYAWERICKLDDLEAALLRLGVKEAQGLQGVRIASADSSGRVQTIAISGPGGTKSITAAQLKKAFSPQPDSSLFEIEITDGVVTLRGKGRGHGAGMCQVGSKGLASPPLNYTFSRILAHYYPGTELGRPAGPGATASLSFPAGAGPSEGADQARAEEGRGIGFDVRVRAPGL